jgi:hypothetical protein
MREFAFMVEYERGAKDILDLSSGVQTYMRGQ